MKYAVFISFIVLGIPAMAVTAYFSARIRGWLVSLMVFATCLGDRANINFVSMETYRGPDRGFEVTLADLLALALAAAIAARHPGRIRWWPYNTAPMLAFFCVAGLTVLWAPQPILSAFTLFKLVRAHGFYWCVVNCLRTGTPLRAVWRGLILMAAYLAFETLRQKYLYGIYRVTGPFDHSNPFADFLNLFMPILLAIGLSDRTLSPGRTALSLLGALAMLFSSVMTFSRAAIVLGTVCAGGVLAFANLRQRSTRVALATLVAFLGLLVGGGLVARRVLERFEQAPEASAMARDEFNRAANLMLDDHPGGVGINQFSRVLTDNSRYNRHITIMAVEKQKGVCHHIYWLTAAEMGYAGLAIFLWVLGRFAWKAFFFAWRTPGRDGLVQAAVFLGTLSLHLAGLLEWVFRTTPLFFGYLLCCGISVALADAEKERRAHAASSGAPA